mmetsp:Transcript_35244/g.101364  ORF Transcript_35244/g.101364 Transcript_35244/m.101364 type:complete len:256 (-) Transcript_35244:657-1424(-)
MVITRLSLALPSSASQMGWTPPHSTTYSTCCCDPPKAMFATACPATRFRLPWVSPLEATSTSSGTKSASMTACRWAVVPAVVNLRSKPAIPCAPTSAVSISVLIEAMAPHSTNASRPASVPSSPTHDLAKSLKAARVGCGTSSSCLVVQMRPTRMGTKGANSASGAGRGEFAETSNRSLSRQAPMASTWLLLLSRIAFSSGSSTPAATTASRRATDPTVMLRSAAMAAVRTSSSGDDTSCTRGRTAPASTTASAW